jgi:hypothetical protein
VFCTVLYKEFQCFCRTVLPAISRGHCDTGAGTTGDKAQHSPASPAQPALASPTQLSPAILIQPGAVHHPSASKSRCPRQHPQPQCLEKPQPPTTSKPPCLDPTLSLAAGPDLSQCWVPKVSQSFPTLT